MRIPWNKGKRGVQHSTRKGVTGVFRHSEKTKRRMSERRKGRSLSGANKLHLSEARRARKKRLGYLNSPEARSKLSQGRRGSRNWNFGKQRSAITKRRIGDAQIGMLNHAWKGGVSFHPYSPDWTERLKQAIRTRDNYTCQICGSEPAIDVHHIDYNKNHCDPSNLITLCHSCHMRTNHYRDFWLLYFKVANLSQANG